jgi:hypothetical protein
MAWRRTVIDGESRTAVIRIQQAFTAARNHAAVCTKCEREIVNDSGEPGDPDKACADGLELLQRYIAAEKVAATVGGKHGNLRRSSKIRKFLHGLTHRH